MAYKFGTTTNGGYLYDHLHKVLHVWNDMGLQASFMQALKLLEVWHLWGYVFTGVSHVCMNARMVMCVKRGCEEGVSGDG